MTHLIFTLYTIKTNDMLCLFNTFYFYFIKINILKNFYTLLLKKIIGGEKE